MGKKYQLSEAEILALVKEYQPILYQPKHDKYEPKFMYYRTRIRGNLLQITYYTVWDNERHPKFLLHIIYAFLFRKFYYGTIKDLEYIQIDIDLRTREMTDVRYEQPHKKNYHVILPFHRKRHLKLVPNPNKSEKFFLRFHGKKSDQFHGVIKPNFTQKRIHMAVASWNHIYDLYLKEWDDRVKQFSGLILKKFDYKTYKKYKTHRRSKGDF